MTTSQIPFLLIGLGYLLAGATHIAYIYAPEWRAAAGWMARLALGIHSLALAAEFWRFGSLFETFYESTLFVTWAIVLVYVLADFVWPVKVGGSFLLPGILAVLVISLFIPRSPGIEMTGVTAGRFFFHVILAIIGYGLFAVAFILSVLYLLQEHQLRHKEFRLFFYRMPSLESLEIISFRLTEIGFPVLTASLIAGHYWAREAWTGNYQLDWKLIWTWTAWLYYGVILLAGMAGGIRGRRFAWLSAVGFGLLMINYFVVNLFFSVVHGF